MGHTELMVGCAGNYRICEQCLRVMLGMCVVTGQALLLAFLMTRFIKGEVLDVGKGV